MVKSKQKEMDQLIKENNNLRAEFENSLDRQKTHSFALKNHQQTLIEEISKSCQQEIESLTIENEKSIKRKDSEIAEFKKKFKDLSEKFEESSKELEEKNILIENLKTEAKKMENEIRKIEYQRQNFEENSKLMSKKLEFEKNKASEIVKKI